MTRAGEDIAQHAIERFDRIMHQAINLLDDDDDARHLLLGVAGYVLSSAAASFGAEGGLKAFRGLSPPAQTSLLAAHLFACAIKQVEGVQERSDLWAAAVAPIAGLPLFVIGGRRP